ncbi:MAG: peptide chain release factor 2 [Myxococcota bacterium]
MSMTVSEARETLADLTQRLEALGGTFDVDRLRHRIDRLTQDTLAEGFWDDPKQAQKVLRTRSLATQTLERFEELTKEVTDLRELLDMADSEGEEGMVDEVVAQLPDLERGVRDMEVKRMLSGHGDESDAIVTVKPGAGGIDAQDWAEMLMRMYLRWCESRGFKVEMVDQQPGEEAGIKEASFIVRGPYAYGFLRAESGVHRLIRISPFDTNARRHTAFAAVTVVPNLEEGGEAEEEIELKPEDLEVQTMRSGGAGGQHVNRTESAIRIRHIPSGFVVKCQAQRSQHQNRATAMQMIRGLLFEQRRREQEAAFEEAFGGDKSEIGFGHQARTYTLQPYRLVKDERTEHKRGDVEAVLGGDIDDFIETYLLMSADKKAEKQKRDRSAAESGA